MINHLGYLNSINGKIYVESFTADIRQYLAVCYNLLTKKFLWEKRVQILPWLRSDHCGYNVSAAVVATFNACPILPGG